MNPYKVGILKDIAKGLLVSNGGSGLSAVTPNLPTFSQIAGLFSRKKYDDYEEEDDDDYYEEVYEYDTKNLENLAEEILKTLIDIDQFKENKYQYKKALNEYHSIIEARRHREILGVFAEGIKGRLQYKAEPLRIPEQEKSKLPLLLGGAAIGVLAFLLPGAANAKRLESELGFDDIKKEVDTFENEVETIEKEVNTLEKESNELSTDSFDMQLNETEREFEIDGVEKVLSESEEEVKKLEEETGKIKLESPQVQAPPQLTEATDQLQQVGRDVEQLQRDIENQEAPQRAEPRAETPVDVEGAATAAAAPAQERAAREPIRQVPVAPVSVLPAPIQTAPVAPVAENRPTPSAVVPTQPVTQAPAPVVPQAQAQVTTPRPGVVSPTVRPREPAAAPTVSTMPVRPAAPTATATDVTKLSVEDIKQMIGKTEGGKLGYNAANVPVLREPGKYTEGERKTIYKQLFKEAEIVRGNIDVTTGKKFEKDMSEMTIEEVISLGNRRRAYYANFTFKGKPVSLSITTASGKYGFIAAALEDNGYRLFGENWKKETYNSTTQEALQSFLLKTNILRAERENAPVSTAFLYMKHFFGPNSSKPLQILNARDDERMSDIMSDAQKNSNPLQANMTVKQYKEHLIQKGFSFELLDTKKLVTEEDRRKIQPTRAAPQVNKVTGQKVSEFSTFNKDQKMAAASQPFVYVQNNNTTVINRVGSGQNTPRQINNNPGLA